MCPETIDMQLVNLYKLLDISSHWHIYRQIQIQIMFIEPYKIHYFISVEIQ
jgi:hypothetical protein